MSPKTEGAGRAPSLTARLAVAILMVLLAGGVAVTLAALAYGQRAANEAYDRLLIGAASQIAAAISIEDGAPVVDIPVPAFELLALAPEERIVYRVLDRAGETLTGYDSAPPPPDPETTYYDAEFLGEPVRLAAVRRRFAERAYSGAVTVLVGHTTRARSLLAWEMTQSALIVLAAAGICMIGLAVFAIRSALSPLRRIERSLLARDPNDLTPLGLAVPRETEATVSAINRFMARLDRQMTGMRSLIADSAHQLRTPVAALRAQAELAAEETDPDRQRAIVGRIHQRARGLSRLTDQLLNRALIIHRAEAEARAPLDLRSVAIRVAEESDHALAGGAEALRLDLPEDAVMVAGDALSLVEASKNLVNNAVRYGAPPVRLAVSGDGAEARLSVSDAGPGVPEESWPEAGRRFDRSGAPDGAGLGLAIVRAVAEAHGGALAFGRTAEGRFEAALRLPRTGTPPA